MKGRVWNNVRKCPVIATGGQMGGLKCPSTDWALIELLSFMTKSFEDILTLISMLKGIKKICYYSNVKRHLTTKYSLTHISKFNYQLTVKIHGFSKS